MVTTECNGNVIVINECGVHLAMNRTHAKQLVVNLLDALAQGLVAYVPHPGVIVHWDENSFNHQNKKDADIQG